MATVISTSISVKPRVRRRAARPTRTARVDVRRDPDGVISRTDTMPMVTFPETDTRCLGSSCKVCAAASTLCGRTFTVAPNLRIRGGECCSDRKGHAIGGGRERQPRRAVGRRGSKATDHFGLRRNRSKMRKSPHQRAHSTEQKLSQPRAKCGTHRRKSAPTVRYNACHSRVRRLIAAAQRQITKGGDVLPASRARSRSWEGSMSGNFSPRRYAGACTRAQRWRGVLGQAGSARRRGQSTNSTTNPANSAKNATFTAMATPTRRQILRLMTQNFSPQSRHR
jgi:hypothetical protein